MKYIRITTIIAFAVVSIAIGCSNPYTNPQTSQATSEQIQAEEAKQQTELMKEQNKQLTRIANALERLQK